LALLCVLPAGALERRSGRPTLIIGQNETIDDTLMASGETVEINGVINGDLMASGRTLNITGTVKGNVFTSAQNLEISGTVEGSMFSVGQNIILRGHVAHNLYSWSELLRLEPNSLVGFDVVSGCQRADLHGRVDHSITNFARVADVRATVGRDLLFRGGEINVGKPTTVGGRFNAYVHSSSDVRVEPGVAIAGTTSTHLQHHRSRFARPGFYVWHAIELIGAFLVGLAAIFLIPTFFKGASQAVGYLWRSLGLGFAVLVGTPVAIVLLAVTLIGLPLAFLSLALYVIAVYATKIFVGTFVGQKLLKATPASRGDWVKVLALGLVVLTILFQVPLGIGAAIHIAVFCFGLGALAWQLYAYWRAQRV
jgi:cytoskeletal protein CcmA (bactofilin family)